MRNQYVAIWLKSQDFEMRFVLFHSASAALTIPLRRGPGGQARRLDDARLYGDLHEMQSASKREMTLASQVWSTDSVVHSECPFSAASTRVFASTSWDIDCSISFVLEIISATIR